MSTNIILFALLGLSLGSFINAWVWRVKTGKRLLTATPKLSIVESN